MTEEIRNSRMQQKRDVAENWNGASLIPKDGEIIVYREQENDNQNKRPRMKIGDGQSNAEDLDFVVGEVYVQAQEPVDAGEGAVWINPNEAYDTDEISNAVVSGALTVEEQKYTIILTLEDGSVETHILETDENNYPTKLTVNGVVIPWTIIGG